jgi:hypothetical protein
MYVRSWVPGTTWPSQTHDHANATKINHAARLAFVCLDLAAMTFGTRTNISCPSPSSSTLFGREESEPYS